MHCIFWKTSCWQAPEASSGKMHIKVAAHGKAQEKQGVALPPTYLENSEPRSKHVYQKTKCKWGREQKCKLTTGYSHMRRNIRKRQPSAKEDGLNGLRPPTNFPTGHYRQLMLTNIVSSHYSRSWNRGGSNTHPGLTDSGDGGFLQIFYHCHQHLVACDLPKMYPGNKAGSDVLQNCS